MKKPIVILVGPSGVGKSTLVSHVIEHMKGFVDLVTCTTRPMRENEIQGDPYHFVSKEKFEELKAQNYFVEWAEVHGNFYGTPRNQMEEAWKKGESVIMDIDVKGALHFQKEYPQSLILFILPPSVDALRQRILSRESQKPGDLELRLENAIKEMGFAEDFNGQIKNDNLESCFKALKIKIESYLENL